MLYNPGVGELQAAQQFLDDNLSSDFEIFDSIIMDLEKKI